jgi:hypothetical protein
MPGSLLLRIARGLCSPGRCAGVLEPLIADLQHELRSAHGIDRLRRLGSGYCAFWPTFAACAARDVAERDSRVFLASAAKFFAVVVCASFVLEAIGMRWPASRALIVRHPYIGWYALSSSATLLYAVPIGILPALAFGRYRSRPTSAAVGLLAATAGVLLTAAAAGWIAPAIERASIVRQHAALVAATPPRMAAPPSLDLVLWQSSTAKSIPVLVRDALAPPPHRFPGYPHYVAPEDAMAHDGHWRDLRFRMLLVLCAAVCGTIGAHLPHASRGSRGSLEPEVLSS